MPKTRKIDLIRYEYIVYTHLLETNSISEILLTEDDVVDIRSESDQIEWVPADNINVDLIETTEKTGENGSISTSRIKNRICGLFDAEPLDWKYAQIKVGNDTNTNHNIAIARMPESPIRPVIFEISE